MDVNVSREGRELVVSILLVNDGTGHHVPTDSPLRHLILLVNVHDDEGNKMDQLEGETTPEWCGMGNRHEGYYGGLPGKAFAKVLEEKWTEVSPSGAYWNPTRVAVDNRLAAFAADSSQYIFAIPDERSIMVEVSLLFRRAYIELMDQKGWDLPDMIIHHRKIHIPSSEGLVEGELL